MAQDAILFACANPIPEIWPWDAVEAGVRVVATGRSDFPNQVNNSLGFPGIFRGVLDIQATTISDEMAIAAAREIALCAEERGLSETYIMPTMDEWDVFPRGAVATALKAQEQGLARLSKTRDELYAEAKAKIVQARNLLGAMMDDGTIPEMPV
jgi:malate dehydrogenase (oxaloacetate-decarboxylating)